MKEVASTRLTFFFKFPLPLFMAVSFGFATAAGALQRSWIAIPFAFVALLYVAILIWFSPRLKVVSFDDAGIYILEGSQEFHIPWTDVERIHSLYMRWPTYAIKFRNPGRFGRRVFFCLPSQGLFGARMEVIDRMQNLLRGPDVTSNKIYKTP
ncbi:hypothetical protein [Pedosphaera parvula]|uniref:PH domain-containing protein n=1 Tax=Pedosphaera parvula (strain Ellin514) TaxID=320771 RepID=B9XD60_PEDPL|nr:hypothetical protein [Pedosphaera parvula]EEF62006.1 hypothetical protein Cflav_PD6281 [Pedosphaera parvula Ellin514]